ncbi:MAG: hypothetical protein ACI4S4_00760 [Candidatus Ornithospirochaeta sp.]
MKSPLRYQYSPYDSAPISVMNALSMVMESSDFDASLIARVWAILMDSEEGTGKGALEHLSFFLSEYGAEKGFCSLYLSGDQVFLGPGCSLYQTLKSGGSAVAKVEGKRYIAVTGLSDDYLYFFDPLHSASFPPNVENEAESPEKANGKIRLSLLSEVVMAYRQEWGDEREILLLEK